MTTLTEAQPVAPPKTDIIAETLRWVNEERVRMGMAPLEELPKGMPGHPNGCSLANALGACVTSTWWMKSANEQGQHPWFVRAFVQNFDRGRYPELVSEYGEFWSAA